MGKRIRSYRILLFLGLVIALLAGVCVAMPKGGIHLCGLTLRMPTLESIMSRKQQGPNVDSLLAAQREQRMAEAQEVRDSVGYYMQRVTTGGDRFWLPNNDITFFDDVFDEMERAAGENRTVRVVHYGDSQIEMDHITSRLRLRFQEWFGGAGPGLLPLRSFTPVTMASIWANGGMTKISSFGDSTAVRSRGNYGPMMQCWRIGGGVSAGISGKGKEDEAIGHFARVKVLVNSHGGRFSVGLSAPELGFSDEKASEGEGVHGYEWVLDSMVSKVNLNYSGSGDVYGVLVDGYGGVAVDNIPMRGCSGHQFKMVDSALLAATYREMDAKLIIMQFGGNSLPYIAGEKALGHYCKELGEQIEWVKACCPGAKVVFVGPSDMCRSRDGVMQSYPFLPTYVAGLRAMALEHSAAYWSIYDAMGGQNSMPGWVQQGYAGADYMHFTQKGANVMGDIMGEAFGWLYKFYKFRMRCKEKEREQESENNDTII